MVDSHQEGDGTSVSSNETKREKKTADKKHTCASTITRSRRRRYSASSASGPSRARAAWFTTCGIARSAL